MAVIKNGQFENGYKLEIHDLIPLNFFRDT